MDMMMRKGWAVAVVGEEWDGKGCCSDGNPIDDAARVDGSDGVTKMIMFFVCVCVCVWLHAMRSEGGGNIKG